MTCVLACVTWPAADVAPRLRRSTPGKEAASTKLAAAVIALQTALPRARCVYCSATGVSEVGNMAYMQRLGFWGAGTAFNGAEDFMDAMKSRGLGFLEMLARGAARRALTWRGRAAPDARARAAAPRCAQAMEMKAEGKYVSRCARRARAGRGRGRACRLRMVLPSSAFC